MTERLEDIRPSDDEFKAAFMGMRGTATSMGLDVNDDKIREFILHCAENKAQMSARMRGLQNIVHNESIIEQAPVFPDSMTMAEAKVALDNGAKLGHACFESHEWIKDHGNDLIGEDGMIFDSRTFWEDRSEAEWQTGWTIVD